MVILGSITATSALFVLLLHSAAAAEGRGALRPRGAQGQARAEVAGLHLHRQHDEVLSSAITPSRAQQVALAATLHTKGGDTAPTVVPTPLAASVAPTAGRLRKQTLVAVAVEPAADTAQIDGDTLDAAALLKQTSDEMKQDTVNIGHLRSTVRSEVALLRESVKLARAARTRASRKAAARQVRESESLVKAAGTMLEDSRKGAADAARSALKQAEAARVAAQQLAGEASEALEEMAKQEAGPPVPPLVLPSAAVAAVLATPQATTRDEEAGDVD
eukprot:TRINITY_DN68445_c0_g1_i1.p1 TRINITY_DN68445_c0_g1~~TRINITY_DN68445_c0_g1_i1.p1  ORF type:complete len:275 (-),score=66.73 TRINITY_DN68445_c0_g1_i1:120-944(-)